jgi:hypothetical protein
VCLLSAGWPLPPYFVDVVRWDARGTVGVESMTSVCVRVRGECPRVLEDE